MSTRIAAARVDEIPDPGKKLIEADDRLLLLIHLDGRFYCLDDVCTHDGGTLYDGDLVDHAIRCPRHGARFDVASGAALSMPATEPTRTYPVTVEDGTVYVDVE